MAIGLFMDEHVPKLITTELRIRGVDVLTVQEDGRRAEDDTLLIDRATALGRIMFSFDTDMLRESTRRQREGKAFSGLVFAHPTRIAVGDCIRDLELIASLGNLEELENRVVFLPL